MTFKTGPLTPKFIDSGTKYHRLFPEIIEITDLHVNVENSIPEFLGIAIEFLCTHIIQVN